MHRIDSPQLLTLLLVSATFAAQVESTWIDEAAFRDCGPIALSLLGRIHGHNWSIETVKRECGPRAVEEATSVASLLKAGAKLGMPLEAIRQTPEDLAKVVPAILLCQQENDSIGHFVVAAQVQQGRVLVIDAPSPPHWVPRADLEQRWKGVLIVPLASLQGQPDSRFQMCAAWTTRGLLFVLAGAASGYVVRRCASGKRRG